MNKYAQIAKNVPKCAKPHPKCVPNWCRDHSKLDTFENWKTLIWHRIYYVLGLWSLSEISHFRDFSFLIWHCIPDPANVTTNSICSRNCAKNDAKIGVPKSRFLTNMGPLGRLAGRQQPQHFCYAFCYLFLHHFKHLSLFCEWFHTFAAQCPKLSRTLARRYTGLP